MRKKLTSGLILLAVLGTACSKPGPDGGVEVTGTGRAQVIYDVLEFSINAEFRADTKDKAEAGARKASDAIAVAFKGAGVTDADLVAGTVSSTPVSGASYISGNGGFTVRIRDLANAPETIRRALEAGKGAGAVIRWGRVYLKVTDTTAELETARKDALADAKRRAEQLARDGSRKLGKVVAISVASEPVPPPHGYSTSMLLEEGLSGLAPFLEKAMGRDAVFVNLKMRYELR